MEIARREVAEEFIQSEDRLCFNEAKYGVS